MTTFLRQQRRSAFVAGVATAAGLYAYSKVHFQQSIEDLAVQLPGGVTRKPAPAAEATQPFLGATARAWAVRRWNESVDAVFKPAVEALARRNL